MGAPGLTVSVAALLRRPGTRTSVRRTARFDDLAISTAAVLAERDIEVDLDLESISVDVAGAAQPGVAVTGTLTVPWSGECRRCLEPVEGIAVAEIQEIFERRPAGEDDDEAETYPFSDEVVDLEPLVRDAALLALPLAPLCTAGCRGPDPDTFPATVEDEDAGADEPPAPDPRWAALDQLKFD
jgi:uncharacterized protein